MKEHTALLLLHTYDLRESLPWVLFILFEFSFSFRRPKKLCQFSASLVIYEVLEYLQYSFSWLDQGALLHARKSVLEQITFRLNMDLSARHSGMQGNNIYL